MKSRGTSFYAFPSAAEDMNLAFSNPNYKLNFNKFILLNIPQQELVNADQTSGVLNFIKDSTEVSGTRFYNFDPSESIPAKFSDQLVESLRNYIANYDATLRESRINTNTDFYSINELATPIENIFWKWCRKYNLLDLEPALHKRDWDKNLPDFANTNGTGDDYFRKYLWKERDINLYTCNYTNQAYNRADFLTSNMPNGPLVLKIDSIAKFRLLDTVAFSGMTTAEYTGTTFKIDGLIVTGSTTFIQLNSTPIYAGAELSGSCTVYLDYQHLIQYVGEIQAESKVQTSRRNFTEVTAQVPHHAGATPTILFEIRNHTNYYPDLEMPILPQEQQEEIVGAENLNSPIRTNPQNYPGTFYGYFDTYNKTYKCSSGDKMRYNGDYYGIKLSNKVGLDVESYVEKLTDFNASNLDGMALDFEPSHYLKMNLPGRIISNFDDFNATDFGTAPADFDFNAILWYYQVDDGTGNLQSNLYGIEFLNNPQDDFDDCDYNNQKITPYKKLVSNGSQDGFSYIFNLNLNFDVDNDVLPLSYDPTSVYNQFGFDLYQNIMQTNALLQDNFMTIISGFTNMNTELFNLKSLVYNQTDLNTIKGQIKNLNDLLQLYSTFQFQDSDSALIRTNYNGTYPTLQVDVINTSYSDIIDVSIDQVFNYNLTNSGLAYTLGVPLNNQLLINLNNDNNDYDGTANILLTRDLAYKQTLDIYLRPSLSAKPTVVDLNINYNDGTTTTSQALLAGLDLPVDLAYYNTINPTASTYNNTYYSNESVFTYMARTGVTTFSATTGNQCIFALQQDLFELGEYVYVDNFILQSATTIYDMSGVYLITGYTHEASYTGKSLLTINQSAVDYTLVGRPKISQYKGMKISILRSSSAAAATIGDRYTIKKQIL